MVMNDVAIVPLGSSKTGVKRRVYRMRPLYPDIFRQMRIGTPPPAVHDTCCCRIKMNHLPGRMNPGISPAGTHHGDRVIGNDRQRLLYAGLHRATLRLTLPAKKTGAVILDAKCDSHYQELYSDTQVNSGRQANRNQPLPKRRPLGCRYIYHFACRMVCPVEHALVECACRQTQCFQLVVF